MRVVIVCCGDLIDMKMMERVNCYGVNLSVM